MSDVLAQFLEHKENNYQEYLNIISEMLSSGHYDYAEDTLVGIYEWVEEHETISQNQIDAVNNIKNKPRNHYGRRY